MKSLFLSTALAAGFGALALSPASALTMKAPVAVSPMTTDVACRMVEKRVSSNGVTKITKTRQCQNDRVERRVYRNEGRHYGNRRDHRDGRPGLTVRIGQ